MWSSHLLYVLFSDTWRYCIVVISVHRTYFTIDKYSVYFFTQHVKSNIFVFLWGTANSRTVSAAHDNYDTIRISLDYETIHYKSQTRETKKHLCNNHWSLWLRLQLVARCTRYNLIWKVCHRVDGFLWVLHHNNWLTLYLWLKYCWPWS